MTQAELAQVDSIKAWCQTIIDSGNKATPGPWRVRKERNTFSDDWTMMGAKKNRTVFDCSFVDHEGGGVPPNKDDTAFILLARSTSVASAKMLLVTIKLLQDELALLNPTASARLQELIAIWKGVK